jgi:hypothetical protein
MYSFSNNNNSVPVCTKTKLEDFCKGLPLAGKYRKKRSKVHPLSTRDEKKNFFVRFYFFYIKNGLWMSNMQISKLKIKERLLLKTKVSVFKLD